jgi:photosystem II stability/assembly factor-like uncharacterized protein
MSLLKITLDVFIILDILKCSLKKEEYMHKIIVVTILFGVFFLAHATWESIGPYGGRLYEIAKALNNDNVVYAGISENPARLFKSTDAGNTWNPITETPLLWAMATDPTDNNIVYVGGVTEIHKSINGGSNWITYLVANSFSGMEDFDFDPSTSSTVYSVASIYQGDTLEVPGFFKSTDEGVTWTSRILTDTLGKAYAVAVDPSNPNTIYAGASIYHFTYMPRVYKSTNGGATFSNISSGLTGGSYVYALEVHPTDPNIVYAGTYLGGIYRSTNGGNSWTLESSDTLRVYSFSTTPINPNHVYAGTQMAVFKSTNSGASWFNSGAGIRGKNARGLSASHLQGDIVYAGNLSGFFKTSDGGANWMASNSGINGLPVTTFEVAPSQPSTIYAYAYVIGVFKTTDGGMTWVLTPEFTTDAGVDDLAVNYTDSDIVLAVEATGPGAAELFKSTDGGSSWFVDDGGYHDSGGAVATDPNNSQVYWYGGGSSLSKAPNVKAVSWTTNNGTNWSRYDLSASRGRTHSLAIDPTNSDLVYAGGNPALHKTTDGGTNWINCSSGIVGYVYDIAIDTVTSNTVFAITPAGAYKTTDGGTNWTDTGTMNGVAITINPHDNNVIYAGTGTGVYKSTSGGGNWTIMNDGLANTDVTCLDINSDYLYASTDGAGVYRWDINVGITESQKPNSKSQEPRIGIRPNPAKNRVLFKFQIPRSKCQTKLRIYNSAGQLVKQFDYSTIRQSNQIVWDGLDKKGNVVPTGIYFVELVSNKTILIEKSILVR